MEQISSLSEYDNWVNKNRNKTAHTLYRGQENDWPLLPSICRGTARHKIKEQEQQLLTLFKRESKPCLHLIPTNDWDWLVVAQHHSLPTRLLDWSTSHYAALWFALENSKAIKNTRPEVWCMQPLSKDFIDDLDKAKPFSGSRTKIFETSFKIPRVRAQHGCFTLLKYVESANKGFVPLEKNKYLKGRLSKVKIKAEAAPKILALLECKGFHHNRMYPDIDKVALSIKDKVLNSASSIHQKVGGL
jgi:hypothetical protein